METQSRPPSLSQHQPSAAMFDSATIQEVERSEFYTTRDMFKIVLNNYYNGSSPSAGTSQAARNSGEDENAVIDHLVKIIPLLLQASDKNRTRSTVDTTTSSSSSDPRSRDPENTPQLPIVEGPGYPVDADISNLVPSDPLSLPVASIADRYARSMLKSLRGYPLYNPQPFSQYSKEYVRNGVNIGDVGFVTEDGTFDFLFNICPSNSTINPLNLPDGFCLEIPEHSEIRPMVPVPRKTHIFHKPIKRTDSGEYKCEGSDGAILELPDGGIEHDAIHKVPFKTLAAQHGVKWYNHTMMIRGRDIPNGSLYLITSFTKCAQWGIAVFDQPSDPGQGLKFNKEFHIPFRTSAPKYHWKGSGAYTTKVANPNQKDAPNQCVFLRGYKITIRQDIFDGLCKYKFRESDTGRITVSSSSTAAGSSYRITRGPAQRIRGGGGTDLISGFPVWRAPRWNEVVLQTNFGSSLVHPSDLFNAALLSQNPGAKVALTHDDVWCDLLRDNFPKLSHATFMNIAQSYTSTVDEYGCVSLEKISGPSDVVLQLAVDPQFMDTENEENYDISTMLTPAIQPEHPSINLQSREAADDGDSDSLISEGTGRNPEGMDGQVRGARRPTSRTRGKIEDSRWPGISVRTGHPSMQVDYSVQSESATLFQSAHNFNIHGTPSFTNVDGNVNIIIAKNYNNYGQTQERLEKFISSAALYDSSAQDPECRCYPGTRKSALKQFRDWFDNPNSHIAWLHGPLGAGKSAIAQAIAHEYERRGMAATFFFYRSDPQRNDGNKLFPTIAWQLAFSTLGTKDSIIHALDETPLILMTDVETQFEQLVARSFYSTRGITSQLPQTAPIVIIDGVDECSDQILLQKFLTVIGDAVKSRRVPLRFLITSNPEPLIEETLKQFDDITLRIDLAALDDANRDIEKYLVNKFSIIASKRGLDPNWPGQEIIEEFVFKSSGNFMLASTVMTVIGDGDYDPDTQLDMVRNLKPHGTASQFPLLDELFLGILRQHLNQDFLKTFLALLVARSSIEQDDLHEDDATLMNISKKELHIKLRRIHSVLKFKPFIRVYHRSFLFFLEDSSRSGQYHISKQTGIKRYLELIVDSVVRHISMAMEQPNHHETCRSSPKFKSIVNEYPPKIVLPAEDWQDALKPLLDFQDKLLKTSKPQPCRITQVMRDLLLHLAILQGRSHQKIATQIAESNMNDTVTEWKPTLLLEGGHKEDLDSSLSVLLTRLRETSSMMVVDASIIDCIAPLLEFDCVETAARIQSVTDAQNMVDLIAMLVNGQALLDRCGPDGARKTALLASEIFSRVPFLPRSLFMNKLGGYFEKPGLPLEFVCQTAFIISILDYHHIIPVLEINDPGSKLILVGGNELGQNESVDDRLRRSSPNLVTEIRIMLEIARTMRYIHSMDIVLHPDFIKSEYFTLDSNLRTKFEFRGLYAWWIREASIYGHEESPGLTAYTYESNISAFADLFHRVCIKYFPNRLVTDAMQLIKRCHAKDLKSRPTAEDIVKEIETWDLT